MSLPASARLWREHDALAQEALQHPFLTMLGGGTLPQDSFDAYIQQDVYYLECFAGGYEAAIHRATEQPESIRGSLKQLHQEVANELEAVHQRFDADSRTIDFRPNEATLQYTDFLQKAIQTQDLASIVAAMTPCNRLYAYLGQQLKTACPQAGHKYASWIDFYSGQDFESSAKKIEAVLDHLASPDNYVRLAALYRKAMQLEIAFFEANIPS